MDIKKITTLTPELELYHYNEIPVLHLVHSIGTAKIALQGAQLLSWQPKGESRDLFWLSEIEPFELGTAIRGGVPICYPWFGSSQQPAHGTARLRLWQLDEYRIEAEKVRLVFALFDEQGIIEAKMAMTFSDKCRLTFTHYGRQAAQVALHSYFNLADIAQTAIEPLPTQCFNSLTGQQESVPSRRTISENVDCIYRIDPLGSQTNHIIDRQFQRQIRLEHHHAGELVLWNPWHKPTGAMSETAYQTMVCLETARLSQPLRFGEQLEVEISVGR